MKKTFVLLLAVCLLLSGCAELIPPRTTLPPEPEPRMGAETIVEETTEPETEPETEPAPVYFNPLNGEILDEPFTHRIFGVSINNLQAALPHRNVVNADMFFESFVNGSIIRGVALFTEPEKCSSIGPVRSNRLMFNDIVYHYDAVMIHASGSYQVLEDCRNRKIDNFNVDAWDIIPYTSFRDQERTKNHYGYEHTLFALGDGIVSYAEQTGIRTTLNPELDYNLRFADNATPENGEIAEDITITITMQQYKKDTRMVYDATLDKYVYHQYGMEMVDDITAEPEAFRNVLILTGDMYFDGPFQRIRMMDGGSGWFLCGGKAEPIYWGAYDNDQPLWFTTEDGEPLVLGRGNTYVAITQTGSNITGFGVERD